VSVAFRDQVVVEEHPEHLVVGVERAGVDVGRAHHRNTAVRDITLACSIDTSKVRTVTPASSRR